MKPDNRISAVVDFIGNQTKPDDDHGHGTHCAGDGHLSTVIRGINGV